jgi:hypothetical protein
MKHMTINFVILYSVFLFTPCYGLKKNMGVEVELVRNAVVQALNIFVYKKYIFFGLSVSTLHEIFRICSVQCLSFVHRNTFW